MCACIVYDQTVTGTAKSEMRIVLVGRILIPSGQINIDKCNGIVRT